MRRGKNLNVGMDSLLFWEKKSKLLDSLLSEQQGTNAKHFLLIEMVQS